MDLREERADRIAGVILGTAVGDALGLPREGLSPQRALRLQGDRPLRHRFFEKRGMISDDTEHLCITGQALLAAPGRTAEFARSLAWRLRGWLLGLPAGVGFATLRAILKLCVGVSPDRSGVHSAGNGPAMRAPVIRKFPQCRTNRPVPSLSSSCPGRPQALVPAVPWDSPGPPSGPVPRHR